MVILQRRQNALQLVPMQAPNPDDPRFGKEWPTLADLHDALVADSAVFDFDPTQTNVSWKDELFVLSDKSTGQTIFSQASSNELTPVLFQGQAGFPWSVGFLEQTVCNNSADHTDIINSNPSANGTIFCGLGDEQCDEIRRALELSGPVIVVTVDMIIGDNPRETRLAAWAGLLAKTAKKVNINPEKTKEGWKNIHNPINGGHFPQLIGAPAPPAVLRSDIASPFTDLCLVTSPDAKFYICDGYTRIDVDGDLLVSIPMEGRQAKVQKEPDTGGFRIAVTPGPEPIYLDPDSPFLVRL